MKWEIKLQTYMFLFYYKSFYHFTNVFPSWRENFHLEDQLFFPSDVHLEEENLQLLSHASREIRRIQGFAIPWYVRFPSKWENSCRLEPAVFEAGWEIKL